jgi:hypothetical protein
MCLSFQLHAVQIIRPPIEEVLHVNPVLEQSSECRNHITAAFIRVCLLVSICSHKEWLEFEHMLPYLSIKCNPDAVSTTWLISPGFNWKAASSNSFCISPLPKNPRSPIFRALLQSDSLTAKSASDTAPLRIRSS